MRRNILIGIALVVGGISGYAGSVSAGLPPAVLSADGDSTTLMVVFGEAILPAGNGDIPTGTEIYVENRRTNKIITSVVGGTEPGVYEAIFIHTYGFVATIGDTISFTVVDAVFNEPNGYYVLTAADILAGMARYDVIPDYVSPAPLPGFRTGMTSLHPNPFNPRIDVGLELAESGPIELSIFDFRGRRIAVLAAGILPSGPHRFQWDGLNQRGEPMPSGVYLVYLTTPGFVSGEKITLVR